MKKNFKNIFLSLFGIGFSKYAPGTIGSAVTAVFLFFVRFGIQNIYWRVLFVVAVFIVVYLLSVKYIKEFRISGKFDHHWIVTDEFLGMTISALPFLVINNFYIWSLVFGFVFFRFFDVFKFWPVKALDKINSPQFVVLDDVLAGIFSAVIVSIILLKV